MYLQKVEISNIRSIEHLVIEFPAGEEAGWHVLLGSNGAGKSTIVRCISATLIGPDQIGYTQPSWIDWLKQGQQEGKIKLYLRQSKTDGSGRTPPASKNQIVNEFIIFKNGNDKPSLKTNVGISPKPENFNWSNGKGWFSAGYGPFRRFRGGNPEWNKIFYSAPKAGAHLSVFGEDVALPEALSWLKDLDYKRSKAQETQKTSQEALILDKLKQFVNQPDFLPFQARFEAIDTDGEAVFSDAYQNLVKIVQMSDGYRSILSLTLELIRQLIDCYGVEIVFPETTSEILTIEVEGVVLIDEIDTHLHPTWQTKVGQWFTKHFPKLQFIVTTHSPFICRATEKGTIWKLPTPNTAEKIQKLDKETQNKLVYGDILDAFDTGVFGTEYITRGREGKQKQARYKELAYKKRYGHALSTAETTELTELKRIFHTHVETN